MHKNVSNSMWIAVLIGSELVFSFKWRRGPIFPDSALTRPICTVPLIIVIKVHLEECINNLLLPIILFSHLNLLEGRIQLEHHNIMSCSSLIKS